MLKDEILDSENCFCVIELENKRCEYGDKNVLGKNKSNLSE